ncbi:transposase [Massilia sp. CF038]|uniref:transposase n=1 Tax=Massilia sp. CF038 TaxID=1881045 RepID=UPI0009120A5A|nr:transposase [Massilia sp. CF038]SHH51231.1 putative transposase [Massilia sp. CF038]
MSRFPRPVFPHVPLHIIQRGNNRLPCFFSRNDYQTFLDILADARHCFPCHIHAYVLMPNHVHLLATPVEAGAPAALMKWVSQRYVQRVNKKYQRFGTLWQGRYRSCLVETERYFIACQRYIELNPVRATLSRHPADYDWSSYRANAFGQRNPIITPHAIYTELATDPTERHACYRSLVDEAMSDSTIAEIRSATNSNMFFGSTDFADRMGYILGRNATLGQPGRRRA